MPVDYYPGQSVELLSALLAKLQNRQISGGITEVIAAGVRTSRTFNASGNSRTETEIMRVLYSLFLRAPNQYANPYAQKIRRTRARYTFS